MSDAAVWLGGPYHGRRDAVPLGTTNWQMAQMEALSFNHMYTNAPPDLGFDTISSPIISIPVGNRYVKAIVYPDIRPEVAKHLLSDYVLAAWQKYDITHKGGRR